MFKKHSGRRSSNIVFVIFRLGLSVVMFVVLLSGIYIAYKQFSGLDPFKIDPLSLVKNVLPAVKLPDKLTGVLGKQTVNKRTSENVTKKLEIPTSSIPAFRFLLVADSHNDNLDLAKAISQAKQKFPDLKFIIGLGDYTEVGTISELEKAKNEFDSSSLRYFLIPGDHDLWDCRNRSLPPVSCFTQVFGPNYQAFTFDDFKFLLLDNSDNYTGLGDDQLKWVNSEFEKAKTENIKGTFVFMHEPLYHPSYSHVMGWVEKDLKIQAGQLLFQFREAEVKKIFTGDIHLFSEYSDPNTNLSMVTIGAITSERNPQVPRFGVVSVFWDGKTVADDIEIK